MPLFPRGAVAATGGLVQRLQVGGAGCLQADSDDTRDWAVAASVRLLECDGPRERHDPHVPAERSPWRRRGRGRRGGAGHEPLYSRGRVASCRWARWWLTRGMSRGGRRPSPTLDELSPLAGRGQTRRLTRWEPKVRPPGGEGQHGGPRPWSTRVVGEPAALGAQRARLGRRGCAGHGDGRARASVERGDDEEASASAHGAGRGCEPSSGRCFSRGRAPRASPEPTAPAP